MKVAILTNSSGRPHETYSVIMRGLAAEMAAAGDQAVLIGLKRTPGQTVPSKVCGFPFHAVGRPGSWLHAPLAALQMGRIFRREGVSLAHFHMAGPDYLGFFLLAWASRLPFVLTFHSFDARRLKACGKLYPAILSFLLRRCAGVTAVSSFVARALEREFPQVAGRVGIVGNGVDRASSPSPADGEPFVLYAGPLCHEKGVDLLLLAYSELASRSRALPKLLLCGEDLTEGLVGDLIGRLGLGSMVDLLGPRPHEQVLELMERCQFYVCAAREETFGIAILEAMACGKAVAAPRTGGVPDYIQDGVNGLLFQPGDPRSLAAAIERLAAEPGLRSALGSQARGAARRFTWDQARRGYHQVYGRALAVA